MSRYYLTDFEWRVIEPLLPHKPRAVPRVDDRRTLNGIFWVLRSERRGMTFRNAMAAFQARDRFRMTEKLSAPGDSPCGAQTGSCRPTLAVPM